MTKDDYLQFGEMLCLVGEMYGKSVSPQLIQMYFSALQSYQLHDVKVAFNLHVRNPDNGQFMPKPADVVRMIDGGTNTQGMSAWTKVLDAIKSVGSYRSVAFDDPVIHRVISDMGGWSKLCECKEDETPFVARDFEKRYQGYALRRSALKNDHQKLLLGRCDAENMSKGYEMQQPMLVGNSQAALATIAQGKSIGGNSTSMTVADLSMEAIGGDQIQRRRISATGGSDQVAGKHATPSSSSGEERCITYEEDWEF